MNYGLAIESILAALPDAEVIYLFGSRARGDARVDSDVDLAVLRASRIEPTARFELQERIAAQLRADVDLVDLRAASTVMRVQVIDHGVVLYERSRAEREAFEATALSAYVHLNEERRGIVEDIRRNGRIHG